MLSSVRDLTAKIFDALYKDSGNAEKKMVDWCTFYSLDPNYDPGSGSTFPVLNEIGRTLVAFTDFGRDETYESQAYEELLSIVVQERDIPSHLIKQGYIVELANGKRYEVVRVYDSNPVAYEVDLRPAP